MSSRLLATLSQQCNNYEIIQVFKERFLFLNEYWKSAAVLSFKYRERTRLYFFVDILYCTLRYGANDTDYILFDYYKKTHFNRNQYITWLRTFAINSKFDERGVHELINKPRLNYNSLNTVRIVTATDSKGDVSVLSAILRMGTGYGITDNLCSGGIACAIDLDTGYLIGPAKNTRGDLFNIHPVSQIPFNGFQVPNFKECMDMVFKLCHMIPYARYVGWDIAITTRGVCVIEGNMPPSEETTEFSSSGQWQKLNYILTH